MRWRDWRYWEADFSTVQELGRYFVSIDGAVPPVSRPVRIDWQAYAYLITV